jgi:hypothetical protein
MWGRIGQFRRIGGIEAVVDVKLANPADWPIRRNRSVNDIDQNYGVSDLTLDMAQLFKPVNK